MIAKSFKITILCALGMVVSAMSDVVCAQVLSNRPNQNQNQKLVTAPAPNTAVQKPVEAPAPAVESAPSVKKNLSAEEKSEEYNNSSPKIVSFKIVNGEVILDEEKERSILIYYDNYQVHRGLDEYVRCSMRIYVLNDLKEKISSLGFKLYWPEISTSIQMNQLNPGVRTYKDIMLMGDGCFALDKAPTIEVNRCRVKGMSQEKCADAVKWYEK